MQKLRYERFLCLFVFFFLFFLNAHFEFDASNKFEKVGIKACLPRCYITCSLKKKKARKNKESSLNVKCFPILA